jgi:hypothetical protein
VLPARAPSRRKKNSGRGNDSASATKNSGAPDSTRTVRYTVRGSKQQAKAGIGGALKRLFRQAVKAVTGREIDAPAPKKSGRRRAGDDTARRFSKTAARLTRLRLRPAASSLLWLTDTLDWLELWHNNELADDPPQEAPNNHLSPRL